MQQTFPPPQFSRQWVFAQKLAQLQRLRHPNSFALFGTMGKAKRTRKFAEVKRMLSTKQKAESSTSQAQKNPSASTSKSASTDSHAARQVAAAPTSMFLTHNEALAPPYRVLVDTNFISLSLENRIDLERGMMDCLLAKCIPCISDCVIAELEKLGEKYRLALRIARSPSFERLPCNHKGTYADDCIANRVTSHRVYIVATCDRALRRRLRKIPGVPLMNISKRQYAIERLPDALH